MMTMDISRPTLPRVDDYLLGGGRSFATDRRLAEWVLTAAPGYPDYCVAAQAFVRRAALNLLDAGYTQFVHLGCGMPTLVSLNDVVTTAKPGAAVVYVEDNAVDCEVRRVELYGADHLTVLEVPDLGDADRIVADTQVAAGLDWRAPIAVIAHSALPRLSDLACQTLLRSLHQLLPDGSAIALAQPGTQLFGPATQPAAARLRIALRGTGMTFGGRTTDHLRALLGPWTPASEGIRPIRRWRPDGLDTRLRLDDRAGHAVLATNSQETR